ncbi:MAG: DUF3017 domain-containing protein [Corynebacterium sp.]|nr:DUF3017 domain-containing protein [Corynebacterium sp.]
MPNKPVESAQVNPSPRINNVDSGAEKPAPKRPDPLFNPHDVNLPPSFLPTPVQWVGMAIFYILLVAVVLLIVLERWRRSTFTLGVAMVWLAVMRAACDSRVLGIFAVRSRFFDCIFNILVGAGLLFFSTSVDSLGS